VNKRRCQNKLDEAAFLGCFLPPTFILLSLILFNLDFPIPRVETSVKELESKIDEIRNLVSKASASDVQDLGEMLSKYPLDSDVQILSAFSPRYLQRIIVAMRSLRESVRLKL
jgi:hypothetical protein